MQAKEKVLDRIEQTGILCINNWKTLLILPTIYFLVISSIFMITYRTLALDMDISIFSNNGWDNSIFISSFLITNLSFFLAFIIQLILYIPFYLGLVRGISMIYNDEKNIDYIELIRYGFNKTLESFKTYYFIFIYVFGWPVLIFILGGLLVNYNIYYVDGPYESQIGILTFSLIIGFLVFLFFLIYRGTRAKFALLSAVDKNDFSKKDFQFSVSISKGKWWRIFGNILLVGIIIGLVINIVSGLAVYPYISSAVEMFENISITEGKEPQLIYDSIIRLIFQINFGFIFIGIIKIVSLIFLTVFLFIFYKRLELETSISSGSENFTKTKKEQLQKRDY